MNPTALSPPENFYSVSRQQNLMPYFDRRGERGPRPQSAQRVSYLHLSNVNWSFTMAGGNGPQKKKPKPQQQAEVKVAPTKIAKRVKK